MGKKRSATSTKAKKVVRQRAAQMGRAHALAPDPLLPEWRRFLQAFPDVPAAVAAASAGREVSIFSSEHAPFRRRVVMAADGPVIEDRIYPHQDLRNLVATAWLNHPSPTEETAEAVKSFLLSIVPSGTPADGLTVVQEQGTGPVPVFGYLLAVPAEGLTAWEEADERNSFGPLHEGMRYLSDERIDATDEMIEDLRSRGLPVRQCSQCQDLITNGHPMWPGVWVVLREETGPLCYSAGDDGTWDDLYTIAVHGPHQAG
ncbi:hypothetical protein ACH4E7_32065 [Kitasatospora sp. NPDC018058]|uniref:hypothetical protein n=1 Tax=Kitasatospora sp. NPDC018058 TaxID=3364025 RepID=UPI0037C115CD